MSIATETASEYLTLAIRVLERGRIGEALHYLDRAQETLLREEMRKVHVKCLESEGVLNHEEAETVLQA